MHILKENRKLGENLAKIEFQFRKFLPLAKRESEDGLYFDIWNVTNIEAGRATRSKN